MKIAVDVRSLMEGGVSGVERYTAEIVREMVRLTPQNEYHLFYNSARKVTLPDFAGNVTMHALRYPNKVFKTVQRLGNWPKWDRLLYPELGRRALDVVFMPSLGLMPLSAGVPLVSVFHDLSYEHFPELFNFKKRIWHWVMQPKKLAERSNAIIAVSEHTKHDLMNVYGVQEKKISVVYSGVNLSPPNLHYRSVTGGYSPGVAKRGSFILYLGTLEPRKNVDSLVRAYSAIAGTVEQDLVIAGAPGWSMGALIRAIDSSPVRERIHLIGFVPEEDKAALYAAADVFVYPSLYEGFGFPPLEALLSGTPVITSFNSALPEVVGEWATLIDPYNVSELALVLQEILRDKPIVSEDTKSAIRAKYSWERAAKETLRVIESVSS